MKAFNLNINPTALQVMIQDAERTHPNECCGFLFGRDEEESRTVEIALPIVNSKEGDQRRRFQITPLEYMKAERYADEHDLTLLGVCHSHPEHPAQPSEHDRSQAMPWFSYVIISVFSGIHQDVHSFRLNEERQFEQENILTSNIKN
jgi:proteasome lid subunit RPN8/RPN11